MYSVTSRIAMIKQPYGGYIPPKCFEEHVISDGKTLFESENIHPTLVGLVVDYLTRFMMGKNILDAFRVSLIGATVIGDERHAILLLSGITGLDNKSIKNACQVVGYDVCMRAGPDRYRPVTWINPDKNTISNIRTMVERSILFWCKYGPVVKDGFTFEGGYTNTISKGDGDYLTKDTLWDFKVSKSKPTAKHTLQLLIYYIMGKHSKHREFDGITKIGVFNPRLNIVYQLDMKNISKEIYDTVSKNVIGY